MKTFATARLPKRAPRRVTGSDSARDHRPRPPAATERVHRSAAIGNQQTQALASSSHALADRRGGGQPLDPTTRRFFESRLHHDLAETRVHTDASADAAATAMHARAFTHGDDIAFARGAFAPGTAEGDHLLAHELTHVFQQAIDPSAPAIQRQDDQVCLPEEPAVCEIDDVLAPEEQVCVPEEPGFCPSPDTVEVLNEEEPPPEAGEEQITFSWPGAGTYVLSPDAEYLRYAIAQIVAKGGWGAADNFIAGLAATPGGESWDDPGLGSGKFAAKKTVIQPYGPATTTAGRSRVDRIVPMMKQERNALEQQVDAFGDQVRATAYVRLEANRQNLEQWDKYIADLAPEDVAADIFVQDTRKKLDEAVHSKTKGPIDPMDMAERCAWSESKWEREFCDQYNKGMINCGGQMCHSENWWRNREYESPTLGMARKPRAVRSFEYRMAELTDPAPLPEFADLPTDYMTPDWMREQIGERPGLIQMQLAVDAIRPKLTALGDSGYRIVETRMIDAFATPSGLVTHVRQKIDERRQDYATLMKELEDSSFDFFELGPIIQLILPLAGRDVALAVPGIMAERQRKKQQETIAELVASIGAVLLMIFPPTAPLGLALTAGLAIHGAISGYEDVQRGELYKLGRGSGLFSRQQEDSAQLLMFMGTITMALSALDLAEIGSAVRVLRVTRSVPSGTAVDHAPKITRLEAEAGDYGVTVTRNADEPPLVTITTPDGRTITSTLDELAAPGSKHGLTAGDLEFLELTRGAGPDIGIDQAAREFDVVRRMTGKKDVSEITLPNGHTWKRGTGGRWCRSSPGERCFLMGSLDEVAEGAANIGPAGRLAAFIRDARRFGIDLDGDALREFVRLHPDRLDEAMDVLEHELARRTGSLADETAEAFAEAGARGQRDLDPDLPYEIDQPSLFGDVMPSRGEKLHAGNLYNRLMRKRYPFNEVPLETAATTAAGRPRYVWLDSYNPVTNEIISRKFTQLGAIDQFDGLAYLQELTTKYRSGYTIADVRSARAMRHQGQSLAGKKISGDLVLEVPVQRQPIPQLLVDYAKGPPKITIRDTTGKILNP